MSGTVSAKLVLITAAIVAGVLYMGSTNTEAVFQPTLGIAATTKAGIMSRLMGDDVITAATGIPMLTIRLHGAPTAHRVPSRLWNFRILARYTISVLPTLLRALLLIAGGLPTLLNDPAEA